MGFILRTLITAFSFWVAILILPGMYLGSPESSFGGQGLFNLIIVSLVFGVVNALIRPVVSLLSLPVTCLTLGLFGLVINAAMLLLTAWLTSFLPEALEFDSFWTALFASIIIGIVSALTSRIVGAALPNGTND